MDLGLLYSDFVMDNRELILHIAPDGSGVFRDDTGNTHCAITAFRNEDTDIERDPLSTNQRLFDSGGIELFGTMVVAGPTTNVIYMRSYRTHTAAGRGDTTPVDNAQQSFPGCDGVRSVGGTTMPFALGQGGCFKFIHRQLGTTDIR